MKNFGKMLVGILVLFLVIASTSGSETQEQWKLDISLEKDSFLMQEPIWLDAVLTNTFDDTLRTWGLAPACHGGFCAELTDSVGNPIPYSGPLIDIIGGEGFLIFPEEQYYNCFNLIELFAVAYTSRYYFGELPPGRYYVQGVYAGVAFSNKISFTVVDSQREEKEGELSIFDGYETDYQKSPDTSRPALSKMLESYSNTEWAEIIALRLLGYSDFLNIFPNSGHTRSSIRGEMMGLTDEEKIEYLENAIIKYQGTRAARHAEQLLRRQRKMANEN